MGRARWVGAMVSTILLAGTAASAMAKGEVNQVTIEGPGLSEPWIVTDPAQVGHLGLAALEAVETVASPPGWIDEAYLVTRGDEVNGEVYPLDQVLYIPDPKGGQAVVYYIGFYGGEGPFDRRWFRASTQGQQTMEAVLQEARLEQGKARLAAAGPSPASASVGSDAPAGPIQPPATEARDARALPLAILGLLLVAIGFVAGRTLRPRRATETTSQP